VAGCQTLVFALDIMALRLKLTTIGPSIKGGCVTWRSHPAMCPGALAEKLSRWQAKYGMRFCHHGSELIEQDVYRGTRFLGGWKFIMVPRL
jgi:hypothetical protein